MKELLFLRHAKSSWEWSVEDRNRPLQPKGIKAIITVAQHWKKDFQVFETIVSSPANRALHTATILAHEIGFPLSQVSIKEALYSFNSEDVLRQIKQLDDRFSKIILVGHNPAFTYAADYLSVKPTTELKTADWISLTFAQSLWAYVANGQATYGSKNEALIQQ
jgi:phosphohistidine phosphatase